MMGGEQSDERKAEGKEEEEDEAGKHQTSGSAAADTAGELPQCQMGNRTVDNMCFMISCTNWY